MTTDAHAVQGQVPVRRGHLGSHFEAEPPVEP